MPCFDEQCVKCGHVHERILPRYTKKTAKCPDCGGATERLDSAPQFHDFNRIMGTSDAQPFVTRNIHPDGKPLEIRGHKQLQDACKKFGVIHVPEKQNRIG